MKRKGIMIASSKAEISDKSRLLYIRSKKTYNKSQIYIPPNIDKLPLITGKSINLVLERLNDLSNLSYNWDDDGANSISEMSILKSKELIIKLYSSGVCIDYVFPMRNGGIQLEVDDLNKFIEIEVSPNGDVKFLVYNTDYDIIKTINNLSEGVEYLKLSYKKI